MDLFRNILIYATAVFAAVTVYLFTASIRIEPSSSKRMGDFLDARKESVFDRYGQKWVDRSGLPLGAFRIQLRWAQLGGKYLDLTVGGMLVRSILLALAASAYAFLFTGSLVIKLAIIAIAAAWPLLRVSSAAGDVRKEVARLIPEIATVMAAELDVANSVEQAFERVAEMPGSLGRLLGRVLEQSRQSQLPVFSRGSVQGDACRILSELGMPELARFGSQLDRIASQGIEAPRMMHQVASDFVRSYRSRLLQRASNLDNELLFPMALFFFIPFIVALMLPLMLSLFQAF